MKRACAAESWKVRMCVIHAGGLAVGYRRWGTGPVGMATTGAPVRYPVRVHLRLWQLVGPQVRWRVRVLARAGTSTLASTRTYRLRTETVIETVTVVLALYPGVHLRSAVSSSIELSTRVDTSKNSSRI